MDYFVLDIMERPNQNNTNSLPTREQIYEQKFPKGLFLGGIIGVFFVSLLFNLPIEKSIKTLVANQIYSIKRCPMDFRDLKLHLFLPRIEIQDFAIQGQCFGKNLSGLELKSINLYLLGPSFSPLGGKVKVEIDQPNLTVNTYLNIGMKEQKIKIEDSKITGELLTKLMEEKFTLLGNLSADGLIGMKKQKVSTASIKLTGTDMMVPKQVISNFEIPHLKLGPLIFTGKLAGKGKVKNFDLMQLTLGDKKSDLEVDLAGKVTVNPLNLALSPADLKGKLNIGKKVREAIPILNIYMGSAKQKDGYYNFSLKGKLGKLKPSFK